MDEKYIFVSPGSYYPLTKTYRVFYDIVKVPYTMFGESRVRRIHKFYFEMDDTKSCLLEEEKQKNEREKDKDILKRINEIIDQFLSSEGRVLDLRHIVAKALKNAKFEYQDSDRVKVKVLSKIEVLSLMLAYLLGL